MPCTQFKFKVAAYEFFHGTGKIFPVWSKEVGKVSWRAAWKKLFLFSQVEFVLDYTPKFIVPPIVYEKV